MSNTQDVVVGEFVLHNLFSSFMEQVGKKVDGLLEQTTDERLIMKSLQRGEDPQFDQLLSSMGCLAEHCLSSLLSTLFKWFEYQLPSSKQDLTSENKTKHSFFKSKNDSTQKDQDDKNKSREMAIAIVFCLVLIEVLQQMLVHPLPEQQIQHILGIAFSHFKHAALMHSGASTGMNRTRIVADLYAEVVGVVAKTKFQPVRKKFLQDLEEAKKHEDSTKIIIGLILGMKFFRIKMYPVEDFEASFRFLRELADYSLEVKEREIKHALASLFVEVLVPVAAAVKTEVNIPVLREFVDALYPTSLELSKRKKNQLIMYPLVTCLLCVSQKQFFLNNWHIFLDNCLSNLKHRDQKISRVALESLYRLLWAYTVRIKCESNTATQSRLQSIIKTLFPVGSRAVVPKDTPLSIYVKIIQFIAQERLDFAMKEIILDLLCITRNSKIMTMQPERMNIGLRAFLVVTDSLQQKDGAPPMPVTVGVMPSGNTLRVKKTFLNKMLTEEEAKTIGVLQYHKNIQKALDWILQTLDVQVGQKMMMTNRTSDAIGAENKPKIELFRTCVAALPRLIPVGSIGHTSLYELLSRLTIHIDEELRSLAFNSLQLFLLDIPDKREDVVATFVSFILKQVSDDHPVLLDTVVRYLMQLITGWHNKIISGTNQTPKFTKKRGAMNSEPHERKSIFAPLINRVEGFTLLLLCSSRSVTRKLGCLLLKEVKTLARDLDYGKADDELCIDVLNRLCPQITHDVIINQELVQDISTVEYTEALSIASKCDVTALVEYSSHWRMKKGVDLWTSFIAAFMKPKHLPASCPSAVEFVWPDINIRLLHMWQNIDNSPTSNKKVATLPTTSDSSFSLWLNYLVFACRCAPTSVSIMKKHASSAIPAGTPDWLVSLSRDPDRITATPSTLFQRLISLMRVENNPLLKDAAVVGLGATSVLAFSDLLSELMPFLFDGSKSHKQENVRRKKKRDNYKVLLAHVFERLARHKVISEALSADYPPSSRSNLRKVILDYITDTCAFLESADKAEISQSPTSQPLQQTSTYSSSQSLLTHLMTSTSSIDELRLYFASLITYTLKHLEPGKEAILDSELRRSLFFLFGKWCGKYNTTDKSETYDDEVADFNSLLHITALRAECAVLCCDSVFDQTGLQNGGYLFSWLESLLDCDNLTIHNIGKDAVFLLLFHNQSSTVLLPWLVDKCYTGSLLVAKGCFLSIAEIFNYMDYPCSLESLFNLAIFNVANNDVSQTALRLLLLLKSRLLIKTLDEDRKEQSEKTASSKLYKLSQKDISQQLAISNPEFTIPMLSEIFQRFLSATGVGQEHMLQYMQPWLENIELVLNEDKVASKNIENKKLLGRALFTTSTMGWGSSSSTIFVLNNLTYLTIHYDEITKHAIENCWKTLCSTWPNNLNVLLMFASSLLFSQISEDIIRTAKLIILCLIQVRPEQVIEYLVNECKCADHPPYGIVTADKEPFYKIKVQPIILPNSSSASDLLALFTSFSANKSISSPILDRSFSSLHPLKTAGGTVRSDNVNFVSMRSRSTHGKTEIFNSVFKNRMSVSMLSLPKISSDLSLSNVDGVTDNISRTHLSSSPNRSLSHLTPVESMRTMSSHSLNNNNDTNSTSSNVQGIYIQWRNCVRSGLVQALPTPAAPLYYFRLQHSFIDYTESLSLLRCNVACYFLSEISCEPCIRINWKKHLSPILIAVVLGMDYEHSQVLPKKCQILLANIVIQLSSTNSSASHASSVILDSQNSFSKCLDLPSQNKEEDLIYKHLPSLKGLKCSLPKKAILSFVQDLVKRLKQQLWECEDVYPENTQLKSTELLTLFLQNFIKLTDTLVKEISFVQNLVKYSLQLAVCASNKHYACRALQIFRSLNSPLPTSNLFELAICLSEFAADDGNIHAQSFTIEILLTLLAVADLSSTNNNVKKPEQPEAKTSDVDPTFTPPDPVCHIKKNNQRHSMLSTVPINFSDRPIKTHRHRRSGSVSLNKKMIQEVKNEGKAISPLQNESCDENVFALETKPQVTQPVIVKPDKLKLESPKTITDTDSLLAQIFWISVCMLESDYEHEYLIALKIVGKVLKHISLNEERDRMLLERYLIKLEWPEFNGIQELLLKGLTSNITSETAFLVLSDITTVSKYPIISTLEGKGSGFALQVIALLPSLVLQFGNPDSNCCECAQNIAQVCVDHFEHEYKLQSLAHVMSLYNNNTYNKTPQTWITVVCKYIYETFPNSIQPHLMFLHEMLDKDNVILHSACLQILHSLLALSNVLSKPDDPVVQDALQVTFKHLNTKNWNEALTILKLAVSRSSQLTLPISSMKNRRSDKEHMELPGRTLSFKFEFPQDASDFVKKTSPLQPKSPKSPTPLRRKNLGWNFPHLSQHRTRERLKAVVKICSMAPGTSDTIKKLRNLQSMTSPTSETPSDQQSIANLSGQEKLSKADDKLVSGVEDVHFQGVMRDFDFLNELEEATGDGLDNFNMGIQWQTSDTGEEEVVKELNFQEEPPPEEFDLTSIYLHIPNNDEDNNDNISNTSKSSSMNSDLNMSITETTETKNTSEEMTSNPSNSSPVSSNEQLQAEEIPPEVLVEEEIDIDETFDFSDQFTEQPDEFDDTLEDFSTSDELSKVKSSESLYSASQQFEENMEISEASQSHSDSLSVEFISTSHLERWHHLISELPTDGSGRVIGLILLVFPSLYEKFCVDLSTLSKKGCQHLGPQLESISSHFSSMLDDLPKKLECPLCFAQPSTISPVIEQLKFGVIELHEHLLAYSNQKQDACSCLSKIEVLYEDENTNSENVIELEQSQLELFQLLYKLHYQLLITFQSFNKLIHIISTSSPENENVSKRIDKVHKQLQHCIVKFHRVTVESDTNENIEVPSSCKDALQALKSSLKEHNFINSLAQMVKYRKSWPNEIFGMFDDSMPDFLSSLYFHNVISTTSNEHIFGVVGLNEQAMGMCSKLLEVNIQIQQSLQLLEKRPK